MTESSRNRDNRLIAVLFGVMFVAVADNQMISPLLPDLMSAFAMNAGQAGLLVSTYAMAAAAVSFVLGPLSDRVSRRKLLLVALTIFTAATLLCGLAWSYVSLLAFRAITGAAAGILSLTIISCVGDHFPYRRRGAVMGLVMAGYFAALILGVPAGAFVAEAWSWRWAFGAFAAVGLLLWVPVLVTMPSRVPGPADGISIPGMIRGYGGFLMRTGPLAILAASFLVSASTVGFITYVGTWLRDAYGLSTDWIGMIFLFSGLGALLGSPLAGYLSDRTGKRGIVVYSGLVMAVLLSGIPWITDHLAVVFVGFVCTGIAGAFRHAPLQALVTGMAGNDERGALIAFRNTLSEFGIAGGTALCGVLYVAFGYPAVGAACGVMAAAASVAILVWVAEPEQT